jgi:hypothetical protein
MTDKVSAHLCLKPSGVERLNTGCFSGDLHAFSAAIEKTHTGENLEQYRLFCKLIAFNFGVKA